MTGIQNKKNRGVGRRVLAAALGLLVALSSVHSFAAIRVMGQLEEPLEALNLEEELPEAVEVSSMTDGSIPARSAILLDQQQGKVLYEKNPDEALPPASITKVMTLLLAMEALEGGRIRLDDMVTASDYACSMGGSQIWLEPGEQMSVDDLLKAVAISSANDASVAIGEHIAGTNDVFVDMMNIRAQELGMENTHFLNCTGLDEAGHLTTARDIAIMSRELMKHTRIKDYTTVWMDSLRNGEMELVNTNRLVRFYGGTTGLKTGTTNGAGSCLSATAERENLGLVAVVMGCATSDDRFGSARSLLDYGFANYTSVAAPSVDEQLWPVKVLRGVEEQVTVTYAPPERIVVNKKNKEAITQQVILVEDVEAPVQEGQILGKVELMVEGELACTYELRAAATVERITVPKAFVKMLRAVLRMKDEVEVSENPLEVEETAEEATQEAPQAS